MGVTSASRSLDHPRASSSSSRPARSLFGWLPRRPARSKSQLTQADSSKAVAAGPPPSRAKAFVAFAKQRDGDGAHGKVGTSLSHSSTPVMHALAGRDHPASAANVRGRASPTTLPSSFKAKRFLQAVTRTSPNREHSPDAVHHRSSSISDAAHQVAVLSSIVDYWKASGGAPGKLREQVLRRASWCESIVNLDPRRQILKYFQPGDERGPRGLLDARDEVLRDGVGTSTFFSVWRPTSKDAIRMMMEGRAIGKSLNVKGKSAKRGKLSGFVPCATRPRRAAPAATHRPVPPLATRICTGTFRFRRSRTSGACRPYPPPRPCESSTALPRPAAPRRLR